MLKGHYNFSGFVVSDWGACHSTVDAINNGLDIEMPRAKFFTAENISILSGVKNVHSQAGRGRRLLQPYGR